MRLLHRRCAHPGCAVPTHGGKCQDCHKAFCPEHVGAHEFAGFRGNDERQTSWTRFVCGGCATLAKGRLDAAAREHSRRDNQGYQ
jgi:hypothetical protein